MDVVIMDVVIMDVVIQEVQSLEACNKRMQTYDYKGANS
jgi:hypothetical protein